MSSSDSFDSLFPPGALNGILSNDESRPSVNGPGSKDRKVWKISRLLDNLNDILSLEYGMLWIEGEISGISIPPSGHNYFSIKDERASLKCVLFRNQVRALSFPLMEGQKVLCLGRLNIYGPRGDLQMIGEIIEPWGEGKLRLAFEELKRKLASEGLFGLDKKRALPDHPEKIFVVSSPAGAAVRDFIKTAKDRFPCARINICPSSVQGETAPRELVEAIDLAESMACGRDIIVITRGGGSIEDLWAFNSERLVRRIHECRVPVISAVGHEVDFTLCDMAADVRAATPTAAAHLALPSRNELAHLLAGLEVRNVRAFEQQLSCFRQKLEKLRLRLRDPGRGIVENRLRLDEFERRLVSGMEYRLGGLLEKNLSLYQRLASSSPSRHTAAGRQRLKGISVRLMQSVFSLLQARRALFTAQAGRLEAVSPLACLARGYSLVYDLKGGSLVKSAAQVRKHDRVRIIPGYGEIICEVVDKNMEKSLLYNGAEQGAEHDD